MTPTRRVALAAFALGVAAFARPAAAQDLTLYCSVQEEWCQGIANAFTKKTGISVAMTRKSSGETYAQIKAEAANPKGDIWWGGTGDPHLQAAGEGLTAEYKSPQFAELHPWAQKQAAEANYRTVGIYAGALGFAYNPEVLAKKGIKEPTCWSDLVKPEFKGEIQIANPNSSGTAYTAMASLIQILGEKAAFDYMKALHVNVSQYTKSGAAPAVAVGRGEAGVGIVFLHDGVTQAINGFPVKVVAPCEGTGYEIGSMSIIKNAPNLKAAQAFYEFALTVEAQKTGADNKSYQVPSNSKSPLPEQSPRMDKVKLIDYDFKKYGSSSERKRLLAKWDEEIGSQR
ncbi:ABC transporter substrate-binding protein [Prosthecomicrobium sp. N25]|uniref:ABC transporter substrate-binding protein n=1 Tax=Prosthecomicrobium sp. N25 TaxID=3129254 RepID=UPI003076C459